MFIEPTEYFIDNLLPDIVPHELDVFELMRYLDAGDDMQEFDPPVGQTDVVKFIQPRERRCRLIMDYRFG